MLSVFVDRGFLILSKFFMMRSCRPAYINHTQTVTVNTDHLQSIYLHDGIKA